MWRQTCDIYRSADVVSCNCTGSTDGIRQLRVFVLRSTDIGNVWRELHNFYSTPLADVTSFQGFFFPTCHSIISLWAPANEKGMFVSSLLGSILGTSLTWPLMGIIIEKLNWQCAFYVTAALSAIVAVLWFQVVSDSPDKHPTITRAERAMIQKSISVNGNKKELPPVRKMFRSSPFYALLLLHFSDVWGLFFLLISMPMFMSQVLKFDLKSAGFLSSLPYIARFMFGFAFGAAGDYLRKHGILSVTSIRKLFCVFCE